MTTVGVKDLVVVQTKDAVLVADRNAVQDVKKVVEKIKADGRHEHHIHREVYRPWGKYDSIDTGNGYQVKRLTVKPGEGLSLQMHHHRAEHWIVVSGTAQVTLGEEVKLLRENESIYIPQGVHHCLENPEQYLLISLKCVPDLILEKMISFVLKIATGESDYY